MKIRNSFLCFLFFASYLLSPVIAYSNPKRAQASIVIGKVENRRPVSQFRKVYQGMLFRYGEIIKTGADGLIEIILFNQKRIRIYHNSLVHIKKIANKRISLYLKKGKLSVEPDNDDQEKDTYFLHVETPTATINSIISNTTFLIEYIPEKKMSKVVILSGYASVEQVSSKKIILMRKEKVIFIPNQFLISNSDKKLMTSYDLPLKENELFENQSPLSDFNPNFKVVSIDKDPFFIEDITFKERTELIRHFRKRKSLYFVGEIGSQYITDQFYLSATILPRFKFSGFEAQLRILVYFPYSKPLAKEQWYNYSEWDFKDTKDTLEDLFLKIDHISYKNRKQNIHFLISEIQSTTLAHGLVVNRYSNTSQFPQFRQLGFSYNIDFDTIKLDGFIANLLRTKIFGMRVETRPFETGEDSHDQYKFGLNLNMDFDPRQASGNPQVFIGSLDINFPLLNKKKTDFLLSFYSEVALQGYDFNDESTAASFGVSANKLQFIENSFGLSLGFKGLLFQSISFRSEYRYLAKGFISEYFDPFYEIRRSEKVNLLFAKDKVDFHAILLGLGVQIARVGIIYSEFYYESGEIIGLDKLNNRFHFEINSSRYLLPAFTLKLRYDVIDIDTQKNISQQLFGMKSLFAAEIRYAITKNLDLITSYRTFFEKQNGYYTDSDYVSLKMLFIF